MAVEWSDEAVARISQTLANIMIRERERAAERPQAEPSPPRKTRRGNAGRAG